MDAISVIFDIFFLCLLLPAILCSTSICTAAAAHSADILYQINNSSVIFSIVEQMMFA
jgi:hypothetical protein